MKNSVQMLIRCMIVYGKEKRNIFDQILKLFYEKFEIEQKRRKSKRLRVLRILIQDDLYLIR
jgi:hypothetical protein